MGDAFGPPRMCLAVPRFTLLCLLREKPCVYELDRRRRKLAVERFERGEQLVRRGGGIAEARAGRVLGGVDYRPAPPPYSELAAALAAAWGAVRGWPPDENRG